MTLTDNINIASYAELNVEFHDALADGITKFKCEQEPELKEFLTKHLETFDKDLNCRTFFLIDGTTLTSNNLDIVGFFSISLTTLDASKLINLSKKQQKKIKGHVPNRDSLKSFPAYFIVQLGRNDKYSKDDCSGEYILNTCFDYIKRAQELVGTSLIMVECKQVLFDKFYVNFGFKDLDVESAGNQNTILALQRNNFTV